MEQASDGLAALKPALARLGREADRLGERSDRAASVAEAEQTRLAEIQQGAAEAVSAAMSAHQAEVSGFEARRLWLGLLGGLLVALAALAGAWRRLVIAGPVRALAALDPPAGWALALGPGVVLLIGALAVGRSAGGAAALVAGLVGGVGLGVSIGLALGLWSARRLVVGSWGSPIAVSTLARGRAGGLAAVATAALILVALADTEPSPPELDSEIELAAAAPPPAEDPTPELSALLAEAEEAERAADAAGSRLGGVEERARELRREMASGERAMRAAEREDERLAERVEQLGSTRPASPVPTPDAGGSSSSDCDPSYSGCVPPYPPDLDCADVAGPVTVKGSDPHGLDADDDGVGCES